MSICISCDGIYADVVHWVAAVVVFIASGLSFAEGLDVQFCHVRNASKGNCHGNLQLFVQQGGALNPFAAQQGGRRANPSFADWNNDGRLDLVLGQNQTLRYFEQRPNGTFAEMLNNSNPFHEIYIAGNWVVPYLVDWNNDGRMDLVLGNWRRVRYFQQLQDGRIRELWGDNPFGFVSGIKAISPSVVDWDGDGDLDLVLGEQQGGLLYFELVGHVFQAREGKSNPFDGITVGCESKPDVVDFDEDGDMDLIVGSCDGILRYWERVASGALLKRGGNANPFDGIDVGNNANPRAVDWDRDGDHDLFVGGEDGESGGVLLYWERVQDDTVSLRGGYASPFGSVHVRSDASIIAGDWDNDGDIDLLVGELGYKLRYWERQNGSLLERQGFANPFWNVSLNFAAPNGLELVAARPYLVDMNNDSHLDLVLAASSIDCPCPVRYWENKKGNGIVEQVGASNPFQGISLDAISISVIDWNGDGMLDLVASVLGKQSGRLYWESRENGSLPVDGSRAPFSSITPWHSYLAFTDWDGDGDLDMLAGLYDGAMQYWERAENGKLTQRSGNLYSNPFAAVAVGSQASPSVADWDGDDDLDVVVASEQGQLYYYARAHCADPQPCAHRGVCQDGDGLCRCVTGHTGSDDCSQCGKHWYMRRSTVGEIGSCTSCPGLDSSSGTCMGRGVCNDDLSAIETAQRDGTSATMLSFVGGNGTCTCNSPFSGVDCSSGACGKGHEPRYNATSQLTTCRPCRHGYSKSADDNTPCEMCPKATFAHEGGMECKSCPGGRFQSASGSRSCEQCPSGTYSQVGSAKCLLCAPGRAALNATEECPLCTLGRYAAYGSTQCDLCLAGKFASVGAEQCSSCTVGHFAKSGSPNCSACTPGHFAKIEGDSCDPCPHGYFAAISGAAHCLECPAGREAKFARGNCSICQPGMFAAAGSRSCIRCAAGRFAYISGAARCNECANGFIASAGKSGCIACMTGWIPDSSGAICKPNPINLLVAALLAIWLTLTLLLVPTACFYKVPICNIEPAHGQDMNLVVQTHGAHWVLGSAPLRLVDTGNKLLDNLEKPFHASFLSSDRLLLTSIDGEPFKTIGLESSQGNARIPFPHALFRAGFFFVPVGLLIPILVASICVSAVIVGLSLTVAASSLAISLALYPVIYFGWQRSRLRTATACRIKEFRAALFKENPCPRPCASGSGRAIKMGQLWNLYNFFLPDIRSRNMYFIESNIIRPLTKTKKLSYAELAGPSVVTWFVSHFWGTGFNHFVHAIKQHADSVSVRCGFFESGTIPYWICSLSNNQWRLNDEIGYSDWRESSFYKALSSPACRGTAMVLDAQALPLTRSWCLFELLHTLIRNRSDKSFSGLWLCTSTGVLQEGKASVDTAMSIAERLVSLRLEDAQASVPADKEMIDGLVGSMPGGFLAVNSFVRHSICKALKTMKTSFEGDFGNVMKQLRRLSISFESFEDSGVDARENSLSFDVQNDLELVPAMLYDSETASDGRGTS